MSRMLEVFPNVKVTLEKNSECDNTSVSSKQNSQDFSGKRNKSVKKTTLIRDLVLCPLSTLVSTGLQEHFQWRAGTQPRALVCAVWEWMAHARASTQWTEGVKDRYIYRVLWSFISGCRCARDHSNAGRVTIALDFLYLLKRESSVSHEAKE